MNTPLGRCPICAEELRKEEEFLLCPAGDYKVKAKKFNDRWDRYFQDAKGAPSFLATALSENLLRDLQTMKETEE